MEAPVEIIELVDKFERNIKAYKNPNYKEEQLKQEFINPLFKALGWDVDNISGAAPQYRDVIFEDSIKIGGGTRAPDYCFTLAGRKIFFVEAKKPSVNIDKDIKPSYQLRRYAWSAKLPLSILTDFEELAVYESRSRPKKNDRASSGRIKYLTYKDYVGQWDYLYNTFSKDAVLKGSYDKYAETTKKKKGTTLVDDEFLSEIETWRELLAKDIALKNPDLTVDELNYSVQQIIDRIIFLRMAEDRGAEKYGQLQKLLNKQAIYQELCEIWKAADEKYNSGLFHFKNEKIQKSAPDTLTPHLKIKDGIFKQIIKNLYYPDSPYEFSVLSPEILGNVYEQFLGKVIRLTKGHQAKIEEKPEVKKAGGVYYTPQYIVEYIVENTLGQLCKDKTPQKVSELSILDPSCGSGSFLLGAYNYLLNWHLIYYTNLKDKNRLKDQIYKGKNNEWHLTIKEKKRILLNNIYGVDIDHQAVEVTKLSLLLKVLEGENRDVLEAQKKLYKERALPNLEDNIKCGNSLIGPEIYNDPKLELTSEDIKKINPFDWKNEFPEIMNNNKFDAVIGNPPWGAEFTDKELCYLRLIHKEIIVRMIDSFMYFIHYSTEIMNSNAIFGMIIPSTLLTQTDMEALRRFLLDKYKINILVNLGQKVFGPKVLNTSTILVLSQNDLSKNMILGDIRDIETIGKGRALKALTPIKYSIWFDSVLKDASSTFFTNNIDGVSIYHKLSEKYTPFRKLIDGKIQRGISPDLKEAFVIDNDLMETEKLEKDVLMPCILGENLSRYSFTNPTNSIIYLTREDNINKYPNIKKHLQRYRDKITCKEVEEKKHPWFALHRPRNPKIFKPTKFIGLTTTKKIILALDQNFGYYATDALYLFHLNPNCKFNPIFVLGVLHSKLFHFMYLMSIQGEQRVIPQIKAAKLYDLPFPMIDFEELVSASLHDNIVFLVEKMLKLHKDIDTARTPQDKKFMQRQIDATDKQIDKLVYELYGLTEDEIKIIEDN